MTWILNQWMNGDWHSASFFVLVSMAGGSRGDSWSILDIFGKMPKIVKNCHLENHKTNLGSALRWSPEENKYVRDNFKIFFDKVFASFSRCAQKPTWHQLRNWHHHLAWLGVFTDFCKNARLQAPEMTKSAQKWAEMHFEVCLMSSCTPFGLWI